MRRFQTLGALLGTLLLLVATGCGEGPEPTDTRFPMLDQTAELRTPRAVRHNQVALQIIAEAEEDGPDRRGQALLDGLKFMIRLIDSDAALRSISPDAVQMLHDLTVVEPESALARASRSVLRTTFARIASQIPWYYASNLHTKWEFISLIRPMLSNDIPLAPFLDFYRQYLPPGETPYIDIFNNIDFAEAVSTGNYASMGNYLAYTSFLHFLLEDYPDSPFELPEDRYPEYLEQLRGISFSALPGDGAALLDQDYFVTHVALMLSKWGEAPMPDDDLALVIRSYVDEHYERVMNESGDLVLFAEFVEVLKLFGADDDRITEAEALLLAYQKPDGSWGAEQDVPITEDAYYAFHPTWAVMAALRHPS